MFQEPWVEINKYPQNLGVALLSELKKELSVSHNLYNVDLVVLAKCEANDDVLFTDGSSYYIIHLTWSGKTEKNGGPRTTELKSEPELLRYLEDTAD